ncbi:MAG TPA: hypothetical protein VMG99_02235 [Thermoplasmata archaeon]|jgi:hypothetical protein|nr:hypothetical protein [Thermoplasmata archaeon]
MAASEAGPNTAHGSTVSPISIPWVVLSAVLCGGGLFMVSYWLLTQQWVWFSGVAVVIVGALMFLSPRMGWDHA